MINKFNPGLLTATSDQYQQGDGMDTPLISVITVTYNAGESIRRTLKSVACQTFTDYEHIIIDGASTDATLSIVHEFCPPVTKIVSEKDSGIANAMNKGVRLSSGELIIHLNAGDELAASDVLMRAAESYSRFNWEWAIGSVQRMDESGRLSHTVIVHGFDYEVLRQGCFICHQSVFVKKSIFEKFGFFDESFRISMDYEFWLRIGRHIKPHILPFVVSKMEAGGISSNPLRCYLDFRRARAKNDPKDCLSTVLFETRQLIYAHVAHLLYRGLLPERWRSKLRRGKYLIDGTTRHVFTIEDGKGG